MNKTSCSMIVFALATLTTPITWSEGAREVSGVSRGDNPAHQGATDTTESPQAHGQAVASSTTAAPISDTTIVGENASPPSATAEKDPKATTGAAAPDETGSQHSWVDKVRAQRQARVDEHREAMEARRKRRAPWEHRQYESMGKQREKMRQARQNHTDLREQAQRAHRRWSNPHGEFVKDAHDARRQFMEAQSENQRKQMDLIWEQQEQWMYGQMPHGWNNPWYYRGY